MLNASRLRPFHHLLDGVSCAIQDFVVDFYFARLVFRLLLSSRRLQRSERGAQDLVSSLLYRIAQTNSVNGSTTRAVTGQLTQTNTRGMHAYVESCERTHSMIQTWFYSFLDGVSIGSFPTETKPPEWLWRVVGSSHLYYLRHVETSEEDDDVETLGLLIDDLSFSVGSDYSEIYLFINRLKGALTKRVTKNERNKKNNQD